MINDITNAPPTSPNPAGIKTAKLKLARELTYSSYKPRADNITALSTPGTIEEPATATPKNTDCMIFGSVTTGNRFLLKENKANPAKAANNINR